MILSLESTTLKAFTRVNAVHLLIINTYKFLGTTSNSFIWLNMDNFTSNTSISSFMIVTWSENMSYRILVVVVE